MKAPGEKANVEPLWTPADIAARWSCSVATVMDRVRSRGVPYVWLGHGEANLTGRGAKMVRFRPKAVESWEADQEGHWAPGEARAPARPVLASGLLRGRKAKRTGA